MGNLNQQIPIVVAYQKRKNGKVYLEVFNNVRVDDIIDGRKRKPIIPDNYEILDIGVGSDFEERYKKKYKL
jgi:hypothetical protein